MAVEPFFEVTFEPVTSVDADLRAFVNLFQLRTVATLDRPTANVMSIDACRQWVTRKLQYHRDGRAP
jgi:hypothetical protein